MFLSRSLQPTVRSGHMYRKGLWGSRKTKATNWKTDDEMTEAVHQASDHAAVAAELEF